MFATTGEKEKDVAKYLTKYLIAAPCGNSNMLCMNSLTGALDLIPNDTFAQLTTNGIGSMVQPRLPTEVEESLVARGYLFGNKGEEEALFQFFKSRNLELVNAQPFSFWICPTFDCNLDCTYCFEDRSKSEPSVMTAEMVDASFDAMHLLNSGKEKPVLNIYGGEPLMFSTIKTVSAILSRAKGEYTINIITNGTQVFCAVPVLEHYRDVIHRVQVTLDGVKQVHDVNRRYSPEVGSFDEVVSGIDTLFEAGINTQVRTNLDRNGYERFPEFLAFAKNKGWFENPLASFYFTTVNDRHCAGLTNCLNEVETAAALINIRENMPDAEKFKDIDSVHLLDAAMVNLGYVKSRELGPKFHYCSANYDRVFVFGADGMVYPCPSATGKRELAIGEFYPALRLDQKVRDLWSYVSVDQVEACKDCTASLLCGGGCGFKRAMTKEGSACEEPIMVFAQFADTCQKQILRKAGFNE